MEGIKYKRKNENGVIGLDDKGRLQQDSGRDLGKINVLFLYLIVSASYITNVEYAE